MLDERTRTGAWHAAAMDVPIGGACAPGFEPVRDAFVGNFADRGEVGAAVCVRVDGEVVVDLWGGWTDEARTVAWEPDSLVDVYSVGKAVVATLLLQFVDDGTISLDTPVADIWPEFAVGGKHAVTVAQALSHQAAVPAIREPMADEDMWDWDRMADAVAATPAWWPIGTRHAYHVNTFGHLIGELVRRLSGELPGTRLRQVVEPLDADVWFGVPGAHLDRCADIIWAPGEATPGPPPQVDGLDDETLMRVLAHYNPPGYSSIGVVNSREWRQAEVPSTNGHATARGVARFYAALIDEDDPLLSPDLVATVSRPWSVGPCPMLGQDVAFGLGFTPTSPNRPLGSGSRAFGHFGSGGALGYADPDLGVAFGYVMNHLIPRWQSTRNRALIDAVDACVT
jgi:CubicO group peptidase (beta-lactamase class C family)